MEVHRVVRGLTIDEGFHWLARYQWCFYVFDGPIYPISACVRFIQPCQTVSSGVAIWFYHLAS